MVRNRFKGATMENETTRILPLLPTPKQGYKSHTPMPTCRGDNNNLETGINETLNHSIPLSENFGGQILPLKTLTSDQVTTTKTSSNPIFECTNGISIAQTISSHISTALKLQKLTLVLVSICRDQSNHTRRIVKTYPKVYGFRKKKKRN